MQVNQYNSLLIISKISLIYIALDAISAHGQESNTNDNAIPNVTSSITIDRQETLPKTDTVDSSKQQQSTKQCSTSLFKITGQIYSLQHDDSVALKSSLMRTRILVNYGQYISYPREDGSFEIKNLPPADSYVVEISHPRYIYDPYRVDINGKGKMRARQVNHIQPALVQTVDYPLKFRPRSLHNYFIPRETWRIMDLLFNPMVIMMVVPLIIIWLLPKMMSPQEMQTQSETVQMPEYNVPELSEMMASMFGGQQGQPGAVGGPGGSGGASGGNGPAITGGGGSGSGKKTKRK